MARMTASRPIGTIRGKNEVIRSRKPKERGNEPNKPAWQEWQPSGPQTWHKNKQ